MSGTCLGLVLDLSLTPLLLLLLRTGVCGSHVDDLVKSSMGFSKLSLSSRFEIGSKSVPLREGSLDFSEG